VKLKSCILVFLLTMIPMQAHSFDFFNLNNFNIFSFFSQPKALIGLCVFVVSILPLQLKAMEQRHEKRTDEKVKPVETKMKNCDKNCDEIRNDIGRQKGILQKMSPFMKENHELNLAKIISLQEHMQILIETAGQLEQKKQELFDKVEQEDKQEAGKLHKELYGCKETMNKMDVEHKENITNVLNHFDNVDKFLERIKSPEITDASRKPIFKASSFTLGEKSLLPITKNNSPMDEVD